MAFHPQTARRASQSDINMIPLIDVMLVLLIIFIVAAPLLTHAVRIDLPRVDSVAVNMQPDTIQLGIEADGTLFWNGAATGEAELETLMRQAAGREPTPELHIQADAATPYETLARVMALASRTGLGKIGFVSRPGSEDRSLRGQKTDEFAALRAG
ncbi:MAG: biopolymer transporter ExbD [Candidatus Accumulibacter sp.]|jgi:biopolymer transport protein ExbD|nr:biopolymer transporter ExbD [Accumulibacter sp.]